MVSNLTIALEITLVGMGLVFASIILLWGIMALLVRVTAERKNEAESEGSREGPEKVTTGAKGPQADHERKRRAAAAAVAAAILREAESMEPHEFPLPPTAIVSAWQAVMRSRLLNKRGRTR